MRKAPIVLIADDSPAIRAKLSEAFMSSGFDVVEATDGVDCIKKVFKYFPSFVILDVRMPKITGYQACRFIKNHPETAHIPVMILTALDKPIDELWGYETGADFYRSKNTKIETLVEDVKNATKNISLIGNFNEKEITETDILSFLNEILDNRLFELTLINDVINLSFKTNNIIDLVVSCAQYLYKMINCYCVGFALEYEEKFKVYLYSNYEYGEPFEDLIRYVKETFRQKDQVGIDFVYNVGVEPIPPSYHENSELVFIDNLHQMDNSDSPHVISGGVFLSLGKEDVKQIKTINFLINTMLLVIHNGMLYQKVLDLSMVDELTTLFNRRKILDILKAEMERSKRYGYEMSVIMADIDNFKQINDNFGHKMGDTVLKSVSSILKSSVRKVDFVGRIGGEEFFIVSPQTTIQNALVLAERIRTAIESLKIEGLNRKITLSLGVSGYNSTKDMDKIMSDADEALYSAKKDGKNCVKVKK